MTRTHKWIGIGMIAAIFAAIVPAAHATMPASSYFEVAREDVAAAVAATLAERGASEKVRVVVYSADPVLYRANAPLNVAIQALSFDKDSHKWQANMHIISRDKTVSVTPVQGRYEAVLTVPVLTRKTVDTDVISDADIEMMDVPDRLVRKDTVLRAEDIIGKSPKRSISPNRPIRLTEVNLPAIVKKGNPVEVQYSAPYMKIRTMGQALEDGSMGSLIRIKNPDSQRAITARVVGTGLVETNSSKKTTAIN